MNVFVERPNSPAMPLSILEGIKIVFLWTVAVKDPGPTVQDHLELDVPTHLNARAVVASIPA
jgi:hypothetical protein